jgi:RHS repeat-associated protein
VVGVAQDVVLLHRWDGVQWMEPVTVSYQSGYEPLKARVAVDGDEVHVVWIGQETGASRQRIFYTRSFNRGEDWTATETLVGGHGDYTNTKHDVTIDANNGQVYVAWNKDYTAGDYTLPYCRVVAGRCQGVGSIDQSEGSSVSFNHPELVVAPSGDKAHLVWWVADRNDPENSSWAEVYYHWIHCSEGQCDDYSLPLSSTVKLSNGNGTDELSRNPRLTVDEGGRVHVFWHTNRDESYRYCDESSDCNDIDPTGNWSTPEHPLAVGEMDFDLSAGRNVTGTPVIHVVGDSQYTNRIIDCETDCWLSSPVDLLALVQSATSFPWVRLATARDGRPLLVAGANFGPLGEHTYYLDLSQGSVNYYYANGQAIAQRITSILEDETHLYYLHHDYLGNLTEVTDENQRIVGRARYDAYGRILSNTIPLTLTQRLYAGALYDPDTGLYKIGARWYDPDIGLWLTPDSVVPDIYNPIAWNPYAFNYNNPVNYVDPSGHFAVPALLLLAATGFLGGEIYATAQGYNALDREFWQYSVGGAVGLTSAYFAVADVAFMAGAGLQGAGLWAGSTRLFGWGMQASGVGAALYAWAFQPLDFSRRLRFYHGTNSRGASSIHGDGIILSFGRSNADFNPTGKKGFYVTTDYVQAQKWAGSRPGDPAIVELAVPNHKLQQLRGKVFAEANAEWEQFVLAGRRGTLQHTFDYVEGPMILNPDHALTGLPVEAGGHQLAIFTEKAVTLFDQCILP